MKNIPSARLVALSLAALTLNTGALAEWDSNPPTQKSSNYFAIEGPVEMLLDSTIFQNSQRIATAGPLARTTIGGSTWARQGMTFHITNLRTEKGPGATRFERNYVSLELWALPFRGSETGYVKWAQTLFPHIGRSYSERSGAAGERTVFAGLSNHHPAFRLYERTPQGVWVRATRRALPGPLPRM